MSRQGFTIELWIPRDAYERLIALCDPKKPEYGWLRSGIIDINPEGGQRVRILCDPKRAKHLYDYAVRISPEAATSMRRVPVPNGRLTH